MKGNKMRASKKMLAEAQVQADKLGHAVLVGLPMFADRRQGAQLFDTGGTRKCFDKWRNSYEIADVIWPSNHPLGQD